MSVEEPTSEEIEGYFSGLDGSVAIIDWVVADDTEAKKSLENHDDPVAAVKKMVAANVEHIEIQMGFDWYKDSSKSKTVYTDAVAAGNAYVAG